MNSIYCTPAQRADVETFLDNAKASVLAALDRGERIAVHTHNEVQPFGPDPAAGYGAAAQDFLYTGWTFGVSIGDYPKKSKGAMCLTIREAQEYAHHPL